MATSLRICDLQIVDNLTSGHYQDSYHVKFKSGPTAGYCEAFAKPGFGLTAEDIDILRRVRHKNLVTCIAYLTNTWTNMRVMELGHLSLREYMIHTDLKPQLERQLMCDLFEAVRYLHEGIYTSSSPLEKKTVIHRLIASNKCVLFRENDSVTLKLTDFNYVGKTRTSLWTHSEPYNLYYGAYFAPEVQHNYIFSTASDVFALGILLWEIKTQQHPQFLKKNGTGRPCRAEDIVFGQSLEDISESSWHHLLRWCWMECPEDRPSIQDVIEYWSTKL